ncbi:hypothetical protein MCGE09_00325 [Thaumarchaeota archaeon SCGC AB-539-E09]|nr:hypothetical protein MCGE09_00325 [Thaumarchaeota archaeon SCGC AB-539-E09]
MAHGFESVRDLVNTVKKGDYVIPHFQRDFDWSASMVSDLLISIIHDYYAGTLLFWQLEDKEKKLEMWDPVWGSIKGKKPNKAILDGQQRLSSLHYAINAPETAFPKRSSYYYFFIDLNKFYNGNEDESVFYRHQVHYRDVDSFKTDYSLAKEGYFPVCLLSDSVYLISPEYTKWLEVYSDIRKQNKLPEKTTLEINNLLRSMLEFSFFTETLEKKEIPEICTIFARINSKGLKLNIFDLLNAFLYPHDIQLKKYWENIHYEKLKELDDRMKVYLLKFMSLVIQRYCSTKYLYNLIPGSKIRDRSRKETILIKDKEEFMKLLEDGTKYLENARINIMNVGLNDYGAIKNKYIPNTTMLPVLAAINYTYDKELSKMVDKDTLLQKIYRWYWCSAISGDYSGSSDTVMAKDYVDMLNWLQDDEAIPERVSKIDSIYIDTQIDFTKTRNTNNSRYCVILNLIALNQAIDFYNGRPLATYEADDINDHHIFPLKSGLQINDDLIDSILNRTLIHYDTNLKILNDKPSNYYNKILKHFNGDVQKVNQLFGSHFISEKGIKYLMNNKFAEFIEERNIVIKNTLKKELGLKKFNDGSLIQPGMGYDNEIKYMAFIESCIDKIHLCDNYVNKNTIRLINEALKNNDTITEIKILTSLNEYLDASFKDSFSRFKRQCKSQGISAELRVLQHKKILPHDRYLVSPNASYNFISADTASRGQYSHITKIPDWSNNFNEFWEMGIDLLNNWEKFKGGGKL